MQLNDILALARAGFTAQQIAQLSAADQPAPQPQPALALSQDPLQLILAQLQQINRAGAQQPPDQPLTGEQVLANIIKPPRQGEQK